LKSFEELELIPGLRRAVAEEKYEIPTPIQAQTIPAALEGRDILGCAQTGTGKTAAFALPILDLLGGDKQKAVPNQPQALVLAPTRELAIQIGASFETYGKYLGLRHVLVYGGVKQGNQVRALNRGAHVLVATPGRLLDLMNQGYIDLSHLEVFVLDEADRMMDMGFLPDLKRIIQKLPSDRQSLFFSATLPPKIVELAQRLLTNPVSVNVTPKSSSVKRIEQRVLYVDRNTKQSMLRQILSADDVERAIVFTKTKRGANVVVTKLVKSGINAAAIHGNKSQNARQRALEDFREKKIQVLVATDVAARGIDIDGVTHVINYDLPIEPEAYVHRIGRTGRAGAEGIALSFCTTAELGDLRAIEKLIGHKIPVVGGQAPPEVQPHETETTSEPRSRQRGGPPRGRSGGFASAGRSRSSQEALLPTNKPKRRRSRPKGPKVPRANQPAKQTS
jgi:ATP-dependent RNA helicase RhlE